MRVVLAAWVLAGQDRLVVLLGHPPVQLGEPDHGERVRVALQLQQLDEPFPDVGDGVVLVRLLPERVVAQLGHLGAAGQLHQRPAPRRRVLAGQHAGPVTGQLGLAVPLLQAGDDHPQPDVADREPGQPGGEPGQVVEHGPVDRVAGQRVPEFVTDREPQFFLVEQVHQARRDHDERLVRAERHRVGDRVLGDEQLGNLGQVQDRGAVEQQLVQVRELLRRGPDRAGQEQQPQAPVGEQAGEPPEQHVETGQLTHRHQRRAVGGMLVCTRRDPGQAYPGTIRHRGHTPMLCARRTARAGDPGPPATGLTPAGPRDHGRMAGSQAGR